MKSLLQDYCLGNTKRHVDKLIQGYTKIDNERQKEFQFKREEVRPSAI